MFVREQGHNGTDRQRVKLAKNALGDARWMINSGHKRTYAEEKEGAKMMKNKIKGINNLK